MGKPKIIQGFFLYSARKAEQTVYCG